MKLKLTWLILLAQLNRYLDDLLFVAFNDYKSLGRIDNAACLFCGCLLLPLLLRAWCGFDCISSWVRLPSMYFSMHGWSNFSYCTWSKYISLIPKNHFWISMKFQSGSSVTVLLRSCVSALTELGAFMRTEFLCISVLGVALGPRVKLAGRKSALTPPSTPIHPTPGDLFYWPFYGDGPGVSLTFCCSVVYSTRRFVLSLALCYFVIYFPVLLALRLPRLGKRELLLVLSVRLFDLRLFGFVCFLFLLGSCMGCGLWLWHSLDFFLLFFCIQSSFCRFSFWCLGRLYFVTTVFSGYISSP